MTVPYKILAVALMAASAPWLATAAAAAPISSPLALQNAVTPSVATVQYRREGWHGGHRGRFVGAGIAGATQPYGYGSGYAYGPTYGYSPGYAYAPDYDEGYVAASPSYAGGSEVAYCQQRFRSYDPASGSYLGFDGLRHSCP
jgi:hypothetical protein